MLFDVNTTEKNPQIFQTVQGEGLDAGTPAFFIRLQGCSVHCFFCDEKETWVKRENNTSIYDSETIIEELEHTNPLLKRVVITGGEPSEQAIKPLIQDLIAKSYKVSVETAATGEHVKDFFEDYSINGNDSFSITFSPKEPYSRTRKIADNRIWSKCRELKFVVANQDGVDYLIRKIIPKLQEAQNNCPIFLAPDWYNHDETKSLIMDLLEQYPSKFRLGVQMHKLMDLP